MNCCPNCFHDKFLKDHIENISTGTGNCSFCGTTNVSILEPEKLYDLFMPVLDLYDESPEGKLLIDLIQENWKTFKLQTKKKRNELLCKISGIEGLGTKRFRTKLITDDSKTIQWEKFRWELKHKNRFFPVQIHDKEELKILFGYLTEKYPKNSNNKYFRARIDEKFEFSGRKMRKPPVHLSTNGRANPFGISYLYLASDIKTAISEIRPYKNECLSVAEFKAKEELLMADLRTPKDVISPFLLNGEYELNFILENLPFISQLSEELSKPVNPKEANLEYLPSQYLCEFIKHIGFDGIVYNSSLAKGINFAIFNDSKIKVIKTIRYKIKDIDVKSKQVK
ncbi:MAG: RES family NAD+ phosphorylase [Candidatus Delongbacteria bacterium]|nr:RES family NAD+ phosphorylase [Candidatus Delongbacteria bacterium]MCG2760350.1 RES family NAD+ phosphorylase [Candidatus Delongbacteria bacterium]